MSSRLTTPVSKLTRSISSTASAARPSHVLSNGSKGASAAGRKRQSQAVETADMADHYSTAATAATPHRPTPRPQRTIPLMQGFRTSAPKPARLEAATIDTAFLPNLMADEYSYDPYANIRVPLMPDNHSPPAGFRQPEAVDAPLPRPEILVVAANPELVLPAALTEVEGMGVDGVELKFAHELGREEEPEPTMLTDLWKGLVEDVFGSSSNSSGSRSGKYAPV